MTVNVKTNEITITRGLAELKTLDDRISKSIRGTAYIGLVTGKKVLSGYNKNEDFETEVKSKYQSVKDLIKRRNAIKTAIVKSNAETTVNVAGLTMTVAEAIERKTSIRYEQELLNVLRQNYNSAIQRLESEQTKVDQRLDELVKTTFGKDAKVTAEQYNLTADPFLEQNKPKLIDPLSLKKEIDELEQSIDDFLLNVDYALSESNSIARITI